MPNTKRSTLSEFVRTNVKRGAFVATDSVSSYDNLGALYDHQTVNHSAGLYVSGRVSTNGFENFWSLLKRGLHGTYVQVAPFHLFRYLEERVFTFQRA